MEESNQDNLDWEDEDVLDDNEEEDALNSESLFDLFLQEQIDFKESVVLQPPASPSASETPETSQSAINISQVLNRVSTSREHIKHESAIRSEAKQRKLDLWAKEKAAILCRIGMCFQMNMAASPLSSISELNVPIPTDKRIELQAKTVQGVQHFIGWMRAEFRVRDSPNDVLALLNQDEVCSTRQGTESQLVQLMVLVCRSVHIPSRVVVRFPGNDNVNDHVWAEFYVDKRWHRCFASVQRVLKEEEKEGEIVANKLNGNRRRSCAKLDAQPMRWKSGPGGGGSMFVLAFGEANRITVVTPRYHSSLWLTCRKQVSSFVNDIVDKWNGTNVCEDLYVGPQERETELLQLNQMEAGEMPTTKQGFQSSRGLFVLQSSLGRFQYIPSPTTTKPVHYFKGEAVYSRDQIHYRLTEFMWRRRRRRIKSGELPVMDNLFELSQTEEFDPGQANEETGQIPVNEYGNVEIWALPRGTVHIESDKALLVCQHLEIPHARVVIGFEHVDKRVRAKFQGIVVSSGFHEVVQHALGEQQAQQEKEATVQKRLKRAQEWRRLLEAHWTLSMSTLHHHCQ